MCLHVYVLGMWVYVCIHMCVHCNCLTLVMPAICGQDAWTHTHMHPCNLKAPRVQKKARPIRSISYLAIYNYIAIHATKNFDIKLRSRIS